MEYLESLSNIEFIRFILNDENSLISQIHRKSFFREMIRFGEQYYCLDRKSAVKGLMRALADTYLDIKLERVDISETNLHIHTFNHAKKQYWQLKWEEVQAAKAASYKMEDL